MTMPFVYVQGAINLFCRGKCTAQTFFEQYKLQLLSVKAVEKKQLINTREQWNQVWSRTDLCLQNLKTCCFCKNSTNGHDP